MSEQKSVFQTRQEMRAKAVRAIQHCLTMEKAENFAELPSVLMAWLAEDERAMIAAATLRTLPVDTLVCVVDEAIGTKESIAEIVDGDREATAEWAKHATGAQKKATIFEAWRHLPREDRVTFLRYATGRA